MFKNDLNRLSIKSQVRQQVFQLNFQKNLEKQLWVWLRAYQVCHFANCFAGINAFYDHKFPKSWFVNFDLVNVLKLGLFKFINELLLNTYPSIVIKLIFKVDVVGLFQLEVFH